MAENNMDWEIYISSPDSQGGRALRRQVAREGGCFHFWEPGTEVSTDEGKKQGLLLPFLEIGEDNQEKYLPKVALSLQKARGFTRTVLLLREPLPEVLSLMGRHQEKGLKVTAVCAGKGELYGAEKPEEAAGPVEELLDALRERLASSSPRKRLVLPYGEKEKLPLTYAGDLASASLFVLRHDEEGVPLLVEGVPFTYGEMAKAVADGLDFGGRLQFGKGKLPKATVDKEAFRVMQGHALHPLQLVLPYLLQVRARGGKLTLSACVIMRDNETDIGRCLQSLAAADEIIVVDTGSVDRSIEIAKEYTDKIYHFDWIDDFAAAKNFALSKASGDWIVFPDSDEFFSQETAGNLHRIAEDYDGPGGMRQLMVRHMNVDEKLQPLGTEAAVSRIFTRGLHYVGAIHEYLENEQGSSGLTYSIPRERLLMKHTGYSPARQTEKRQRNEQILRRLHEEGREVGLQHYYMGKILMGEGKYAEAREEMLKARESTVVPANLRSEIYRIWYNASRLLEDEAAMEEAREAMERELPNMPDSYAIKGVALWNEGKEEEAVPFLTKALELTRDFLKLNPREMDVVGADMPAVARELTEFYEKRGEMESADKIRNMLT